MLFVTAVSCLFFSMPALETAGASSIESQSGNVYVFTGFVGYSPTDYFTDAEGQSTLVNAKVFDGGGKYYSIGASGKAATSSGWGDLMPTPDMQPFIENGLMYAKATASVQTSRTSVTISVSNGGRTSQITTKSSGQLETDLLRIDSFDSIKFAFSASALSEVDFTISEPTIRLYTQIRSVTLKGEDMSVSPGQVVKINAYNDVTSITSQASGNFMSLSKIRHEIKYDFECGSEWVDLVGSNMVIKDNAPDGAVIKFRVYSLRNTYSDDLMYSLNYLTFTVDTEKVNIQVKKDFENPATITGEGQYYIGRQFTLTEKVNPGFEFLGWYENGAFVSDNEKEIFVSKKGQSIYAKFRKSIRIAKIDIAQRDYDGSTNINKNDVLVTFDGLESGHDVTLGGTFAYYDANAGQRKMAYVQDDLFYLTGADAELYTLDQFLPEIYGTIRPKDVTIIPMSASKEYGYADPIIRFTASGLIGQDTLLGEMGRTAGEAVGKYSFTTGNLGSRNPNYNAILLDNGTYFEIVKRNLTLQNVLVKEKVYDGTREAQVQASLANIYNNEDVRLSIKGEFLASGVGNDIEVRLTELSLSGSASGNYTLSFKTKLYGNILKRPATVTARPATLSYGDPYMFEYDVSGLVDGDFLYGKLEIDNLNVGEHDIKIGTLQNANYELSFESAVCKIVPRKIIVEAVAKTKYYGDADPELTIVAPKLVGDDTLSGSLERTPGEDAGKYKISIGTLSNPNYEILLFSAYFEILKRPIDVEIEFADKVYDGTDLVTYEASFSNNIKGENFELSLEAKLASKDYGTRKVIVSKKSVSGDNIGNYTFNYIFKNQTITVSKRAVNVFIEEAQKTYGDPDPDFVYAIQNAAGGEELDIKVLRTTGENVGFYNIYVDSSSEKNINYEISFVNAVFQILPRELEISVKNQSKTFGDADPFIEYDVIGKFYFDDTKNGIINGRISREEGEDVGVYPYILESLSSSPNYVFKNVEESHFIINKRTVTVVARPAQKNYGADDPEFWYDVEGAVDGYPLTVQIDREKGEDVGTYALTCETKFDSRYEIEFVSNFLTIDPCDITIKAENKVKVYGNADPALSITITNGFLQNNDVLERLITGSLERTKGEDVGYYTIGQGTLSLGRNYKITFEEGQLEIIKRHVTISAVATQKTYGDETDPEIQYVVGGEGLVFDDAVSGFLTRQAGKDVGDYQILIGTISFSENYDFDPEKDFVSAVFKITPKQIQIIPTTLSKQYGEADEEIRYQVVGGLAGDDVLAGSLYRDRDFHEIEHVGRYLIHNGLYNPNYEIVLGTTYFTILPREIVIRADDKQMYYSGQEPELTYKVISGTILGNDKFTGGLYRSKGASAGTYDILSNLTLGRNYSIQFIRGQFTIIPLDITIESKNYVKTYGQQDPMFTYEIKSGELKNNDVLYGSITREQGENAGVYNLVCGVYNVNYNITLLPAQLEILKKDVYLISAVYDKVYDGTNVARLKNPYISGAVDEIYLDYDINNSAIFETAEVGKHIAVHVYGVAIAGAHAMNYNLILPEVLYADITLPAIENDDVTVFASDPVLYEDYSLNVTSEDVEESVRNYRLVLAYNIWMQNEDRVINEDSGYTIVLNIPGKLFSRNNIVVYQKNAEGKFVQVTSQKGENGQLVISAQSLGEFYIAVEDETWMDYGVIAAVVVISVVCTLAVITIARKAKKKRETNN